MRLSFALLLLSVSAILGANADASKKESIGASPTQDSKLPSNARIVKEPVIKQVTLRKSDGESAVASVLQNRTLTILEAPSTKANQATKTVTETETKTKTVTETECAKGNATGAAAGHAHVPGTKTVTVTESAGTSAAGSAVAGGAASKPSSEPKESGCLLYTSPSPRDVEESRMPSSA